MTAALNPHLVYAAYWLQGVIFLYFLAINSTYTLLILFALKDIVQHGYLSTARGARRLLTSDTYYKPVSVIVPAFNEAAVLSSSVRSLLNLHYPEFEVIVINDGSTDDTIARLKADFKLGPYSKPVRRQIPHEAIKDIYISADYPNLIVVDKANGGKSDAINAGINVSSFPIFCSIDADSLLEPDAILKASKLFIEDDEIIATGGIVRVLNGCTVKDGAVLEINLPQKALEAIQVLEYTRAFLSGRTGWNIFKSLLIISGAFGVFRKDMVIAVNGYRKTVGEDMDLVMRLHRHCMDKKIPYRIFFVPDPVCWTQVPFNLEMLRRQRNRWHRGLIDCLINNRALIMNPKYGAVSLVGVSYFFFVEFLGPIIELLGYLSIPILYFAGLLNTKFVILFITVAILWGISINIAAIFLDTFNFRRYKKDRDIIRLCFMAVLEFLGYRQITLYERVKACFSFRETSWGTQDRQAHSGETAPPQLAPLIVPTSAIAAPKSAAQPPAVSGLREYLRRVPGLLGAAAAKFLDLLPALALALLCLRIAELYAGIQTGTPPAETARIAAAALRLDLLGLARYLPAIFLLSLPFLLLRSRRAGLWGLALSWSLLVFIQTALAQYFLTAHVPLGSDLLGYTWQEIVTTAEGGLLPLTPALAGLCLAMALLWAGLSILGKKTRPSLSPRAAAAALALSLLVLAAAPRKPAYTGGGSEYVYNLKLNKASYFFDDIIGYLAPARQSSGPGTPAKPLAAGTGFKYLDPAYPFLRAEQTPDTLGPYFKINAAAPPNFVFIIVEGLGRSFSGPGAVLGSFTPQLDQLAENGLYWENFLAGQGRTFGVLPSVFGSLPFGKEGFEELGAHMPEHISLPGLLKANGYRFKCYAGSDLDFDNESVFLNRQGIDRLVDMTNFGAGYQRSNSWGYADGELVTRALAGEAGEARQPFVTLIKTMSTHTPYTFLGQQAFASRFEQRLNVLGVPEAQKASYHAYRDIYTTILYTDAALGRFFEEAKKNPSYNNTIFVLTGDHRLPELPMASRIDRYHVPLLVFSPLLKAPARIRSVSSHFDITPSLLAFLAHNYGFRTPGAVTWLGSGLDLEPSFRNVHTFPVKQTITDLVDFVSGDLFLSKDTLYRLEDGMGMEPYPDAGVLARVRGEFAAFRAANDQFARSLSLFPKGTGARLAPYDEKERRSLAGQETSGGLSVLETKVPAEARPGGLTIEVVFSNSAPTPAAPFVPLVVLLDPDGREISESYGPAQRLGAGEIATLLLPVRSEGVAAGRYFLTVIPSDPETGKKAGTGRHNIPVIFHD
ncbi:MAG TPA: sulfatase-like hydrolase/transferase [Elusimicrobiales bacterium]|nr:sulfatase-like hydrolase/transferase [Elusimicrobiales bacterium]